MLEEGYVASPGSDSDSFLDCSTYSCSGYDEFRIMKCSRMTLIDRKENLRRELDRQRCSNYQRLHQPQLHNYLAWLNKPHSVYDEQQPYLTICNLALPKNVSTFVDRGAQSEKWVQKRPRLQSGKAKKVIRKSPDPEDADEETKLSEEEQDSECMEIQQIIEDYEIDENVQRLIQEAAEYDLKMEEKKEKARQEEQECALLDKLSKKMQRKSAKYSTRDSSDTKGKTKSTRLSRTVTLSLSKAPSPETVQVIRVDVTSNYSLEELDADSKSADSADEDDEETSIEYDQNDGTNTERNRLRTRKSLIKCVRDPPKLTLHCQKLPLTDRSPSGWH